MEVHIKYNKRKNVPCVLNLPNAPFIRADIVQKHRKTFKPIKPQYFHEMFSL
jgi:hypothetical protein